MVRVLFTRRVKTPEWSNAAKYPRSLQDVNTWLATWLPSCFVVLHNYADLWTDYRLTGHREPLASHTHTFLSPIICLFCTWKNTQLIAHAPTDAQEAAIGEAVSLNGQSERSLGMSLCPRSWLCQQRGFISSVLAMRGTNNNTVFFSKVSCCEPLLCAKCYFIINKYKTTWSELTTETVLMSHSFSVVLHHCASSLAKSEKKMLTSLINEQKCLKYSSPFLLSCNRLLVKHQEFAKIFFTQFHFPRSVFLCEPYRICFST